MHWSDTTLSGLLRHEEEIEALVTFAILNEIGIDNRAWCWVLNLSTSSISEHSLVDSFIYNNKSDRWRSTNLVVEWL